MASLRRRYSLLSLLSFVAAATLGCGIVAASHPRAVDAPERAFERLNGALQSKDWGAVYDSAVSPSTRTRFNADFEKVKRDLVEKGGDSMFAGSVLGVSREEYLRMNARDFFVKTSEAAGKPSTLLAMIPDAERMRNAKVVDTTIEGDDATLTVDLEGKRRQMRMRRESGSWYLDVLADD